MQKCWATIAMAVILAGCSTSKTQAPIIKTGEGVTFQEGCSPEKVTAIITGFMDALNKGDMDRVLRHFGKGFVWYSAPVGPAAERKTEAIYNVSELEAYFKTRIAQKERMQLQTLNINSGRVDFGMYLHRTANDLGWGAGDIVGKGMLDCRQGTISVWSLGGEAPKD
ncbi:MAG TPA: hypothetical protein VD973_29170 [Symbiobacteriaceae bacterium]|nr:hypothetical protein [Symbiobacteriaceae bacterium]